MRRPRRKSKKKKGRNDIKLQSLAKNPTGTSMILKLINAILKTFSLLNENLKLIQRMIFRERVLDAKARKRKKIVKEDKREKEKTEPL